MKIEGPLYLIKGEGQTSSSTPTPVKKNPQNPDVNHTDVIRLVQTENQRALTADPDSLAQAKALVSELVTKLKQQDEDQLDKLHRVDPGLLFRLF